MINLIYPSDVQRLRMLEEYYGIPASVVVRTLIKAEADRIFGRGYLHASPLPREERPTTAPPRRTGT